jgi:phage terminase small subunit
MEGSFARLTEKQKRFVDEYLIDLNATQAAIRAGYKPKWVTTNVTKLLENTSVQKYLTQQQKALSERTEITQDRVLKELAKIGFADIRKAVKWSPSLGEQVVGDDVVQTNGVMLVDSDSIDDDTAAAVAEISQTAQGVKIKFHDKRAALVDIGRHLGMFTDKVEHTGKNGGPIEYANMTKDDIKRRLKEIDERVISVQ